jgi:hypothetical protein
MQFYFCEMKDYGQHEWNYNKFDVIIKLTPSVSLGSVLKGGAIHEI